MKKKKEAIIYRLHIGSMYDRIETKHIDRIAKIVLFSVFVLAYVAVLYAAGGGGQRW